MTTIDWGLLGKIISVLVPVLGALALVWRYAGKIIRLENKVESMEKDTKMIIHGLWACLEGLHEQGCNGSVTATRDTLKKYIVDNR